MYRILVVEDNPTNMNLVSLILENANYSVIRSSDAEAALVAARDQRPDLILMDIQLPGIDGLQATALLKDATSTNSIPVIALTAFAMKGDEERIRAAGCAGYIAKPIRYKEVLAVVAEQLARA